MKQEFVTVSNPSVRVLRWNEKLLEIQNHIMFRVHDTTQDVVRYKSGHQQKILSHKTSVETTPPIPFVCCCSEIPDTFRIFVRCYLHLMKPFDPHNELLSNAIHEYFCSCFECNCHKATTTSPKVIVLVEVYRKTLHIYEQETDRCEESAAADQDLMDVDEIEEKEEDCSEFALRDILENLLILHGCQHANLDDLFQVKPVIRMLIYNERSCSNDDKDECAICLDGFREGDHLARMPCSHVFHKKCAFKWLLDHGSCPLCRTICKTPLR